MKKALTQTIIVFVAVNLITAGFALAQNVPDEGIRDTITAQAAEEADFTRKQMEAAQKEAEVAQKQMKAAQKEMKTQEKKLQVRLKQLLVEQTQAKIFPSTPDIRITSTAPQVRISSYPHSSSGAVLVIPAAEMKIEDLAAITEDMNVMSRIFAKKLSQARLTTVRSGWSIGIDPLSFGRSSGAIEAIYLEGYGALFLMRVNALLAPPPEALEEKETEEEDTDPLWTQMRQEMYAPQEARRRRTERPEEKYDAEKVEGLKETLIKTLKHAANIRALKPDESVILTVTGKASQSGQLVTRLYSNGHSRHIATEPGGAGSGSFSPTVLTIRAKKSDIDAFAEGRLSFDQFTQKTLLLSYSYLGENVGGPSRSSLENVFYGGGSRRSSTRRPR